MGMVGEVGSGVHQESLGLKDQREELGLRQRVSTRAALAATASYVISEDAFNCHWEVPLISKG